MAGAGVRVIWAEEACKLWPLEVSCTAGKEDGGQTKRIHHSNEVSALPQPVLPRSTQTGSIMQNWIREDQQCLGAPRLRAEHCAGADEYRCDLLAVPATASQY